MHPADLERAAEVMALTASGAFDEYPITPALYRTLTADGGWVTVSGPVDPVDADEPPMPITPVELAMASWKLVGHAGGVALAQL